MILRYVSGYQHCSLVAHWLLVPGDHSTNPGEGEKFSSFGMSHNLMIAVNLGKIHDYAKQYNNEIIHHV